MGSRPVIDWTLLTNDNKPSESGTYMVAVASDDVKYVNYYLADWVEAGDTMQCEYKGPVDKNSVSSEQRLLKTIFGTMGVSVDKTGFYIKVPVDSSVDCEHEDYCEYPELIGDPEDNYNLVYWAYEPFAPDGYVSYAEYRAHQSVLVKEQQKKEAEEQTLVYRDMVSDNGRAKKYHDMFIEKYDSEHKDKFYADSESITVRGYVYYKDSDALARVCSFAYHIEQVLSHLISEYDLPSFIECCSDVAKQKEMVSGIAKIISDYANENFVYGKDRRLFMSYATGIFLHRRECYALPCVNRAVCTIYTLDRTFVFPYYFGFVVKHYGKYASLSSEQRHIVACNMMSVDERCNRLAHFVELGADNRIADVERGMIVESLYVFLNKAIGESSDFLDFYGLGAVENI